MWLFLVVVNKDEALRFLGKVLEYDLFKPKVFCTNRRWLGTTIGNLVLLLLPTLLVGPE